MNKRYKVAGIGEVLWDILPQGNVLGGAPANVAYHAHQLGAEGYIISAVGNDILGDEIISRLSEKGIGLLINRSDKPTGTVKVSLRENGVPDFEIIDEVAWDYIELTSDTKALAKQLDAVCFGTLAQRNNVSLRNIRQFLESLPEKALIIFDINLRQDYYNKQMISESLAISNILKINDGELISYSNLFNLKGSEEYLCRKLLEENNLKLVAYTCGEKGSYLFSKEETSYIKTPEVKVKDTIGAGDSFTAALMVSLLCGFPVSDCHALAVEISAFVCENNGAMPDYSEELVNKVNNFFVSS